MSPSRRRVTARCAAWHPAPLPCGMAVRPVSGALGVSRCHALRGYRGRTETPPAKLSACATCQYSRALPTATGRCGAMGTSRPTAITHAKFARRITPAIFARASHAGAHRRASPVGARHPVGAHATCRPHSHGAQNVCGSTSFDWMLKRFRTKLFHPPDEPGKKVFHFALSQRRKTSAVLFRQEPKLARPLPETVPQPSTKKLPESFRNALEPVPISYRLSSWPRSSPCRYCSSARTSPADNATHGQSSNRSNRLHGAELPRVQECRTGECRFEYRTGNREQLVQPPISLPACRSR